MEKTLEEGHSTGGVHGEDPRGRTFNRWSPWKKPYRKDIQQVESMEKT